MSNAIMIEDTWTANCAVRPGRPSTLRAVPEGPDELDEELDEELEDDVEDDLDLDDSTDADEDDDEAQR